MVRAQGKQPGWSCPNSASPFLLKKVEMLTWINLPPGFWHPEALPFAFCPKWDLFMSVLEFQTSKQAIKQRSHPETLLSAPLGLPGPAKICPPWSLSQPGPPPASSKAFLHLPLLCTSSQKKLLQLLLALLFLSLYYTWKIRLFAQSSYLWPSDDLRLSVVPQKSRVHWHPAGQFSSR